MGDPFYSSRAWRRVRRNYLARHPFCEDCLAVGEREPATQVDHRLARTSGGAPFAFENLSAKCSSCHSRKTASVDRGFGNARKARVAVPGCDVHGRPLDPQHAWRRGAASDHGMPAATDRAPLAEEGFEGNSESEASNG